MLNYQIKAENTDFLVNEIAQLFLEGGDYCYYLLQKSGFRTTEAVEIIAQKFGIASEDITYSGLKDEDAVTTQYIAIKNFRKNHYKYSKQENWLQLTYLGDASEKLEIGNLFGNAFRIRIRNIDYEAALKISELSRHEVRIVNYYDIQRFGMPNLPKITHYIGKALIDGDFETAFRLMAETGNITQKEFFQWSGNEKQYLINIDKRKLNFYLSAWDSFVWNQKIQNEILNYSSEYEKITRQNLTFVYTKFNDELLRHLEEIYICRHTFAENFSISEKESFRQPSIGTVCKISKVDKDTIYTDKYMLDISFILPSGAYATALIDQLIWYSKLDAVS